MKIRLMTFPQVKEQIRGLGMTVRKTPEGEYRVNFSGGSEATAYYTSDPQDVVDTATAMSSAIPLQKIDRDRIT